MKKIISGMLLFLAIFGLSIPWQSKAQEGSLQPTTDAFKWYKFPSVDVKLATNSQVARAGDTLYVKASISNANDYPIVDGSVFIKVFKKQIQKQKAEVDVDSDSTRQFFLNNGDFLVDQWVALDNIILGVKETKQMDFTWKIPASLTSGEYRLASYVVSAKKFNLSGLSFTEDIIGNNYDFTILGGLSDGVQFDKNNVKINDEPYDFVGFINTYGKDDPVVIAAPLQNNTNQEQKVTLSWDLYYWDGLLEKNKLKTYKEDITLAPKETKTLTYTIAGNDYPVNYVTAKAIWQDAASILNIRFGRNAEERVRANFMGISQFPIQANQKMTAFVTAHAVTQMDIPQKLIEEEKAKISNNNPNYTLMLTLKDRENKVVESWEYKGDISGNVMGFEKEFIPNKTYDYVVLEASLKNSQGAIVDETRTVYDCASLNSKTCSSAKASLASAKQESQNFTKGKIGLVVVFLVVAFFIAAGAIYWLKRRSIACLFVGAALASVMSLSVVSNVQASDFIFGISSKSLPIAESSSSLPGGGSTGSGSIMPQQQETKFEGFLGDRGYKWYTRDGDHGWSTVNAVDAYVLYSAQSSISNIESIGDLPVGKTFTITDTTLDDPAAIFWNVRGFVVDSPYGCFDDDISWRNTLKTSSCAKRIYYSDPHLLKGIMLFQNPAININTHGSPVSCSPIAWQVGKWNCTVTAAGDINISLEYGDVQGNFFYYSNTEGNALTGKFRDQLNCTRCSIFESCFLKGNIVSTPDSCSDVTYHSGSYRYDPNCSPCGDPGLMLPSTNFSWHYTAATSVTQENIRVNVVESDGTTDTPSNLLSGQSIPVVIGSGASAVTYAISISGSSANVTDSYVSSTQPLSIMAPPVTGYTASASDNCSGSLVDGGSCTVTLRYTTSVLPPPPPISCLLTVNRTGIGVGTVTSSDGAISCGTGGACSASYSSGSNITLNAWPTGLSAFGGWSGACTGVGTCSVAMSGSPSCNKNVTATFNPGVTCTPDCSCKATTCLGATCGDGCGGLCDGEKICSGNKYMKELTP